MPPAAVNPETDAALRENRWSNHVRVFRIFVRVTGAKLWHYWLPLLMTLIAAGLEGASMALLLPLAKGLANDNFGFVWRIRGIRQWHARFPDALGAATSPNRSAFLLIVSILFVTSLAGLLAGYLAARLCSWRNGVYAARVKAYTLGRCLSFGKLYFDRTSQAAIGDMIGYSETVLTVLALLERAADQLFRLVAQIVVMITISWPLTLFMCLALPVLRAVDRVIVRRSYAAAERVTQGELAFGRKVYNVLSCIPLVKAFALEDRTQRTYEEIVDRLRGLKFAREAAGLAVAPLQQAVALCALMIVVSVAVVMTKTDHTVGLSMICAFLLLAKRTVPMLGFPTDLRVGLAQARPHLDRLAVVFDDRDKFFVADGPREFRGLREGIELRNLNFSYVDGQPVLRGLSCVAPAGVTTALVGETGCGKTTIASLITRLYECQPGSVLLDGVDIREFSRASLARHTAFVGQDAWLFNDSLRANLVIGLDREVADDELLATLGQVHLGSLVLRQPEGLAADIGDRGLKLSGGEKQRLCIARALLRRADLIVLDEATASLDSQTERDVQHVLEQATHGRTVIMIAHRLSTVRNADKILVLSQGAVIQQGSWAQLVHQRGPFATMWEVQTRVARADRPLAVHDVGIA